MTCPVLRFPFLLSRLLNVLWRKSNPPTHPWPALSSPETNANESNWNLEHLIHSPIPQCINFQTLVYFLFEPFPSTHPPPFPTHLKREKLAEKSLEGSTPFFPSFHLPSLPKLFGHIHKERIGKCLQCFVLSSLWQRSTSHSVLTERSHPSYEFCDGF